MISNLRAPDEAAESSDADKASIRELVRTLNAYENAAAHKTANSDSENTDLLLENAAIRLSLRMLSAMARGACHGNDSGTTGAQTGECPLDDESVHLRDLTDMLSYAASRLQQLAFAHDATTKSELARISSLEHLYRMTFAIAKAHFDRSQSGVYFRAAREQLALARNSLQTENQLCACSSKGYGDRLRELSDVDQLLAQIQDGNTR